MRNINKIKKNLLKAVDEICFQIQEHNKLGSDVNANKIDMTVHCNGHVQQICIKGMNIED